MGQWLSIALAKVKTGNISGNLLMKSDKLYSFCVEQKKLPKKYTAI